MKKSVKILWSVFFTGIGLFVLLILLASWGVFGRMPSIEELENPSSSLASQVYAQDGTLMGKYLLEDRVNVDYDDISKHVINALIATEDERFYDHSGIDARSVARAFFSLGSEGGASTITMQTAKNLFTGEDYTRNKFIRSIQKIKEAIIAIKLERNFTKDEIITLYLNTVPFSDNVFGIRNAARTFFQKEPNQLSIEESATLIGMLKGSTLYNPRKNPQKSLERRNTVINQMVRNKFLTESEAENIKLKPIVLDYKKLDENTGLAPYFRMILGEEMKKWCRSHTKSNGDQYDLYRDGLKIYTTINPKMQLYAEEAVGKHISYLQKIFNTQQNIKTGSIWNKYENVVKAAMKQSDRWKNMEKEDVPEAEIEKSFYTEVPMKVFAWNNSRATDTVMTPYDSIKYHRQMLQAGFMAMDPQTGEIKAWVGGVDFKTFKFDHVNTRTKRQVGSTIKPLLYGLAIEDGGFTPTTPVEDVQQRFGQYGVVPATGRTCSGRTMSMAQALAGSRNCATAYIMKQLGSVDNDGAKRFVEFLKNCNVDSKLEPYPSIALGSGEISLYEMMQAYSMFPGRGFIVKPTLITRIEDKNGNTIETFSPERKEVISEITAYSVVSMMQGVVKFGTGRRIWGYGVQGEVAGKTGTTNDNSDAWFMGYTPQLLAGVWTGADDRFIRFSSRLGEGSSQALPIWAYFYQKCSNDPDLDLNKRAKFIQPDSITNEIMYDWQGEAPINFDLEGENIGNGTSEDYGDLNNPDIVPEDIAPESQIPVKGKGNQDSVKNLNKSKADKPKNKDTLTPPPAPKAVLPRKKVTNNN